MKSTVIENKNLFLEIVPEMGASIINFKDKRKNSDIFRPFPNSKKLSKYNSYFTGYFATVPYFGAIQKNSFYKQNKYTALPRKHILEPDTIHILSKGKIIKTGDKSLAQLLEQKGYSGIIEAA